MSEFAHGELELARVTGIALKVLQKNRKGLAQGVDWDLNKLRVAYSKKGLAAALEKISGAPVTDGLIAGVALSELEEKTLLEKPAAGPAMPPMIGTVARLFPNPTLLAVTVSPAGDTAFEIKVRVQHTKNFRRGMTVPLRLKADGQTYELARRMPRFPGKW